MPDQDPDFVILKAKATIASMAMMALGPEYEGAAEQLADRIMRTISKYSGGLREGNPDERLDALGRAVGESCKITLELLAAVAAGRRGE